MTDPITEIRPGLPVYTTSGDQLGQVKETHGDTFKVDVPMARDYWLRQDAVLSFNAERVTLKVDKDDLDQYKTAAPV
jgi:hypothetical protein